MQFSSSTVGRRALAGLFAVSLSVGVAGATAPLASAQTTPAAPVEKNAEAFDKTCTALPSGLYQSAYSAKENAVYVTRSVGRPPVKESTLFKLDADSLATLEEVTPPAAGEGEDAGVNAVYGVTVDDATNLVWVTNTRQNTVAAYDATTLELKKQFDAGLATHSRDVIVDPATGKAYVSISSGEDDADGQIKVFDGKDLTKAPETIAIPGFGPTMSLDFDAATGKLYTVSLSQPKAVEIDTKNENAQNVTPLGEDTGRASGATLDTENNRLWVAHQESNNVEVVDLASGEVVKELDGQQPLNAKYDKVNNLVYVTNRTGFVSVFDAKTYAEKGVLAAGEDAATGGTPNHVSVDGRGNAYTVNKFAPTEGDLTDKNQVCKVTPKPTVFGSLQDSPLGSATGSLPDITVPSFGS